MGFFSRKNVKKKPIDYTSLVDLGVYIKDIQDCLNDVNFKASFVPSNIAEYLNLLNTNEITKKKKKIRLPQITAFETIDTLKNALVELAINIKAFQEELDALPDITEK